jgi:hypothetical protein
MKTYNDSDDKAYWTATNVKTQIAREQAEMAALRAGAAADAAAEEALWTAEYTAARRAEWNTAMASGRFAREMKIGAIGLIEDQMGYRFTTLKRYIAKYAAN